jgi:hypothetical protein
VIVFSLLELARKEHGLGKMAPENSFAAKLKIK